MSLHMHTQSVLSLMVCQTHTEQCYSPDTIMHSSMVHSFVSTYMYVLLRGGFKWRTHVYLCSHTCGVHRTALGITDISVSWSSPRMLGCLDNKAQGRICLSVLHSTGIIYIYNTMAGFFMWVLGTVTLIPTLVWQALY